MKRCLWALLALVWLAVPVEAATCFWVGGTGNFDNSNTASWSSSTGGGAGTCAASGGIPKNASDVATFDANSGGGTVTVCGAAAANCPSGSGVLTLAGGQLTISGFTGTLDFSTHNPVVSIGSFSCGSTGTRTLNMGSGGWTITGTTGIPWSCAVTTGLTLNHNSGTLTFSASPTSTRQILLGAISSGTGYNDVVIADTSGKPFMIDMANGGAFTINGTLTLTNIKALRLTPGTTHTVTGAITFAGASNAPALIYTSGNNGTLSVGASNTWDWVVHQNIIKAGAGSITCNNCYDAGNTTAGASGITTNNPSTGGSTGGKFVSN